MLTRRVIVTRINPRFAPIKTTGLSLWITVESSVAFVTRSASQAHLTDASIKAKLTSREKLGTMAATKSASVITQRSGFTDVMTDVQIT